ncbi:MAG: hypothetical protein J6T13_04660 [Bacteroidales bacterium]|nr:hypothetical protein [Bacteroidales bacterium]
MNPLTGIWTAQGNIAGYRYASPNGDDRSHGTSTTHTIAHHLLLPTPAGLRPAPRNPPSLF